MASDQFGARVGKIQSVWILDVHVPMLVAVPVYNSSFIGKGPTKQNKKQLILYKAKLTLKTN